MHKIKPLTLSIALLGLLALLALLPLSVQAQSDADRETYRQEMADTIAALDRKIEELKARMQKDLDAARADAGETRADIGQDMRKLLAELEQKRVAAAEKLRNLGTAGANAWEGVKKDMDQAAGQLQDAYQRAWNKLTK